jgi:inosine-uridine nucleoside N-ribohydrolase
MLQPKVILDVDPGIDNGVAVIAALKSNNIDIMGISVVSGKMLRQKLNSQCTVDSDISSQA